MPTTERLSTRKAEEELEIHQRDRGGVHAARAGECGGVEMETHSTVRDVSERERPVLIHVGGHPLVVGVVRGMPNAR